MKGWLWKNGPGTAGLLGWAGLFYWGWRPALLAFGVMVVTWIDGYLNGKEDRK